MKLKLWVLASAVLLLAGCQSTTNQMSDKQTSTNSDTRVITQSSANTPLDVRQAALKKCQPLTYRCHSLVPMAVSHWSPSPEAASAAAQISAASIATLQAIQTDSVYGRAWLEFQIGRQYVEQRQLVASVSYLTSATKSQVLDSLEHKVALKMLISVFMEYHQTEKAREAIENYLAYMGEDAEPVYIDLLKMLKK
jgi:hypothetical protein